MAALRNQVLKHALPLVRTHGFSREALSMAALSLPSPHLEPLKETAVSALFGEGDDARRTLISAWLEEGRAQMRNSTTRDIKSVLSDRLRYNEPVLSLLPEAFALLATPPGFHILDVQPAFKHATSVADEACQVTGDITTGTAWYARRASLAAIYAASEVHQITSPDTAYDFLSNLLDTSSGIKRTVDEVGLFANYIGRSMIGIVKSRGVL